MSHPFDDYLDRVPGDEPDAVRGEAHELMLVNFLLTRLGLKKRQNEVREAASDTGMEGLTLDNFNIAFPSFPILMRSDPLYGVRLHADTRAMLPALLTKFSRAPFVEPYRNFYRERHALAHGRAIGLIFPRKGLRYGLVMHNGGLDGFFVRGGVFCYTGGNASAPVTYYLQPFQPLIDAIAASRLEL